MKIKQLRFRDLDGLMEYNETKPEEVHLHTFKFLRQEWNKNKKTTDLDIFNVTFDDDEEYDTIILTINSNEWVKALELALNYFVEKEEYEMCSQIKDLLTKIQNKQK